MHGPSSSAERLDLPKTKKERQDGKGFWKKQIKKIETQNKPEKVSKIFNNVCVYFEGYTDKLSSLQLKKLLQANGGNVCHHFSVRRTTHIVCTNLCTGKAKRFLTDAVRAGKVIHVVHPDWVLKSTEASKRLSEFPFRVATLSLIHI
eukprot:TRINITY_DN6260_c0_g5_i1.p1 TRINITY_DN6260_c0_g5~~TRINITY_DN6260_c0_g5_i1.p1  ORF type:complete len:147 (+),score=27.85 TRINITY_DN6260_c0_g5_i1:231-671(+)